MSLADTFTDTNGTKHVAATISPKAGSPSQFVVVDATNLQDSADPKGVMSHCCWVQFFNFSAVRTDYNPQKKAQIQNNLSYSNLSPDGTSFTTQRLTLTRLTLTRRIGISITAGVARTRIATRCRGPCTKERKPGSCGRPRHCGGERGYWLASTKTGAALSPGYSVVTRVTITATFESFLMCGGSVLEKVVWQETNSLDYGVYQANFGRLTHDGVAVVDAIKQALKIASTNGGPKYTLVSCGAGTLNTAEIALLKGKKYPS